MKKEDKKLDNPVWHSLSESHSEFSVDFNEIKFYHPDYCSFGGFTTANNLPGPLEKYAGLADHFFIVGKKPPLPGRLTLKNELVCLQMIIHEKINMEIKEEIKVLTGENSNELFQLVNLVQPGYFRKKTFQLGNYYGIFKTGQLVAVAGERMKMNDFTEVSAIVTHPEHTGRGYAGQLTAHTVNNIFNQNKTPYLHVVDSNTGAIRLYEKLGFKTRRKISFWNITR